MKSLLLTSLFFCISALANAQETILDSIAKIHRQSFSVKNETFSGPYLDSLINKIAENRYVLIGEQHHTNEIPAFIQHLLTKVAFDNYVMEGNQSTSNVLKNTFHKSRDKYDALLKKFPDRFGFYTFSKDREILNYFFGSNKNVIDLDQVFASSDAPLLDYLIQITKNKQAKEVYKQLYQLAETKWAHYKKNPNVQPPFKDENLPLLCVKSFSETIQPLLTLNISVEEKFIINDLISSNAIYTTAFLGDGYQSHKMRISLMKRNLLTNYKFLQGHRNLFKFGTNHVSKYKSLLQNTPDVGNLAFNLADAENQNSLHIAIVENSGYIAGLIGENIKTDGSTYLKPFSKLITSKDEWFLYDLNRINKALKKKNFKFEDTEFKNFIEGYDYLIIIPEVTPQKK